MAKRKQSRRNVSVYSNLVNNRRTKKDVAARKKAEYLASLPKHPVKRFIYRMHPKRLAAFWFSKRGAMTALKITGVMILLVVLTGGALFAYFRKDLDAIRPSELAKRVQTTVTTYYDRNGKTLWVDKGEGNYTLVVNSDKINKNMKEATVAIEDKSFYQHGGVSITGIIRAGLNDVQGGSTQGGSTLTQQLVKQVFFADQSYQRGLAGVPRKIKEMILAIEVERMYNKDQILTMYLNESPYGGRRNGVESAAQTYFGKSAKDLTLSESALLAAIPNQPGLYDPYNIAGHPALLDRQHKVLDNMVELKYITKAQADAAKKEPVLDTIRPLADQLSGIKAPHFVLMVRQQLEKELGKATVGQGGLSVTTTLDITIQDQLQNNITNLFNGKLTNRDCGYISCPVYAGFTNGAAAIEDNKTGQVLALVGSRDFSYPGFGQDNAATAFIQPGSSIKPLVYAQLFQDQGKGNQNFGSGSVLSDTRTTFGGTYTPQDADGSFRGNITVRQALDWSRNIPAIKAMAIAGKDQTWATIRAMGDTYYCTQGADTDAGLSSAIGGCGTRVVDHVNAMASLARMGAYMPQSLILKVTNSSGQTLKQYQSDSKQVIDPQAAYVVNDILGDSSARAGLGWRQDYLPTLDGLGIKTAAKTGTSNGETNGHIAPKDIWTIGYTPSLSMAIWLGNPDTTPLRNGNSLIPAMVLDHTMASAMQYYIKEGKAKTTDWFTAPKGIQIIGGQVYPSYYTRSAGITSATMSFDKFSKFLATSCTPPGAKIDVAVTTVIDPFTKQKITTATGGYDATKNDNAHSCSDAHPGVTVTIAPNGNKVSVDYTKGTFALKTVDVSVAGKSYTKQISTTGTWDIDIPTSAGSSFTVTAVVTDAGYYTNTSSDAHSSKP